MMSKTLVIGDPHVEADDPDLVRFDILGNFIAEEQPDAVVQIGDFLTYDSISAWNARRRLTMEGQRLSAEIRAGRDAYDRIMNPIHALNESRRRNRKALYKPDLFWIEGNHCDRAFRYADQNPEMYGMVDYKEYFNPADDDWVVVPYREHCMINGVLFTHIPMSGNNQPLSSKHLVKNVIKDYTCPIVFGHTHKLAWECDGVRTTDGGMRLTALNVGCYFDNIPDYATGSRGPRDWWAGLVMLTHLNEHGDYDLQTIHMDVLRQL